MKCGSKNADEAKSCLQRGKLIRATATAKPPQSKVRVSATVDAVVAVFAALLAHFTLPLIFVTWNLTSNNTVKAMFNVNVISSSREAENPG